MAALCAHQTSSGGKEGGVGVVVGGIGGNWGDMGKRRRSDEGTLYIANIPNNTFVSPRSSHRREISIKAQKKEAST